MSQLYYIYSPMRLNTQTLLTVVGGISHLAVHQAYGYLSAIDAAINGPGVFIILLNSETDT